MAELIAFVGVVLLGTTAIVAVWSMRADHERRRKQATVEQWINLGYSRRSYREDLASTFGHQTLTPEQVETVFTDNRHRETISHLLSDLELFAVGVNIGVYDLQVVKRMSGRLLGRYFKEFFPYIERRRVETGNTALYAEFERLVLKIDGQQVMMATDGDVRLSSRE